VPVALTPETIPGYQAMAADPGSVVNDPAVRDQYLELYGNISYDTRDQYINFPWSAETN